MRRLTKWVAIRRLADGTGVTLISNQLYDTRVDLQDAMQTDPGMDIVAVKVLIPMRKKP